MSAPIVFPELPPGMPQPKTEEESKGRAEELLALLLRHFPNQPKGEE